MPSGKIHAITTTLAAGLLAPAVVIVAKQPVDHAVAFAAGCMFGLVLTPDLDVDQWTRSHTLVRRSAGWLVGSLWYLFWWPYARLIPHRSPLSHTPVVGTLLRLMYILALPAMGWWLLASSTAIPLPPIPALPAPTPQLMWALGGLILVDTLHVVLDYL